MTSGARMVVSSLLAVGLLSGCEIEMLPSSMEPGLRPAIADPAILAPLCGVAIDELGPVSNQGLTLRDIDAYRSTLGTSGHGTVGVRYVRPAGGEPCEGMLAYDFEQPTGTAPPTIEHLRPLR